METRMSIGETTRTFLFEMPMHRREGDDVIQTLQFASDQSSMGCEDQYMPETAGLKIGSVIVHTPRTGVRDIEMIATLFRRELGTRFTRDPIAENGLLSLELARLIVGIDPVGNLSSCARLCNISRELDWKLVSYCHSWRRRSCGKPWLANCKGFGVENRGT